MVCWGEKARRRLFRVSRQKHALRRADKLGELIVADDDDDDLSHVKFDDLDATFSAGLSERNETKILS